MPIGELLGLAMLGLAGWFWLDSIRARDAAVVAAKRACADEGLQLLDDTVAIRKLRLARNEDGQLVIARQYAFEFSDTGNDRRRGSVVLMGDRVVAVHAGLYVAH